MKGNTRLLGQLLIGGLILFCLGIGGSIRSGLTRSEPVSGEVFKEFNYSDKENLGVNAHFDSIPGNDYAENSGSINLGTGNLSGATRAELSFSYWAGHPGSDNKRLSINGNSWFTLPNPETPYLAANYLATVWGKPSVIVPLAYLQDGANNFTFRCGPQVDPQPGEEWPNFWLYEVVVRIYYNPETTTHPTGSIQSPTTGSALGDDVTITADVSGDIRQVDFIGFYDGMDVDGNGIYQEWQYQWKRSGFACHLGTDTTAPYEVTWDTRWVPDQDEPMKIMARIVGNDGMCYMTPVVDGLTLARSTSVKMYKPSMVPQEFGALWQGTKKSCNIDIYEDLSKATAAKLFCSTWMNDGFIGLNNQTIATNLGVYHNYKSYFFAEGLDVPLERLQSGRNNCYIGQNNAEPNVHEFEMNWPGPVLFVKYSEAVATTAPSASPQPSTGVFYSRVSYEKTTYSLGTGNTGAVAVEFDVTPFAYGNDGIIGFADSSVHPALWTDLPVMLRMSRKNTFMTHFKNETLVLATVSYEINQTYHVRMLIDMNNRNLDAWVTPPEGSETKIVDDFNFISYAPNMDDLGKMVIYSPADGQFTIENFTLNSSPFTPTMAPRLGMAAGRRIGRTRPTPTPTPTVTITPTPTPTPSVSPTPSPSPSYLIYENFSAGDANFTKPLGSWSTASQVYSCVKGSTSANLTQLAVHNTMVTGDFCLAVKFTTTAAGSGNFEDSNIVLGYSPNGGFPNYYFIQIYEGGGQNSVQNFIIKQVVNGGAPATVNNFGASAYTITAGVQHTAVITKTASSISLVIDGDPNTSFTYSLAIPDGLVGLGGTNDIVAYDDLQVWSSAPTPTPSAPPSIRRLKTIWLRR